MLFRSTAWDTMIYSVPEVQRITRVAAQVALAANPPLAIHSVDKANVLASSRLWRKIATETLQVRCWSATVCLLFICVRLDGSGK